jgi:hypothetical protein
MAFKEKLFVVVDQVEERIRVEESQENYELCALLRDFKEVLASFMHLGETVTPEDVKKLGEELDALKSKYNEVLVF